ncbi:MAG: hypothetical protein AB7I59_05585 [Geminicoccaceae bacterium]
MAAVGYRAFIAHSHAPADHAWALWLQRALAAYRLPDRLVGLGFPRRPGRIFGGEEEPSVAGLDPEATTALAAAEHLIVICSPQAREAPCVSEAIARFRTLGRGDRILALLVDGEPGGSLPAALQDDLPLVADIRPAPGHGQRALLRSAVLDLVAAMLGLDRGELRERDAERARSRLVGLSVASTAAALLCLGVAGFAAMRWQSAEQAMRTAEARRLALAAGDALEAGATGGTATAHRERGALLALESLAEATLPEGDAALRQALWHLGDAPLATAVTEDETLLSVRTEGGVLRVTEAFGEDGAWRVRHYDIGPVERSEEDTAAEVAASRSHPYQAGSPAFDDEGVLTESLDGALQLREDDGPAGQGASLHYRLVRTADRHTLWLLPHEARLRLAAFSENGRFLLTVTGAATGYRQAGSTVRVFGLAERRLLTELSLAEGISALALSPDRTWLATQSPTADGHLLRLWPLWPATLRDEACRRLTRNLSPAEWSAFLGETDYRFTCPSLPITRG